MNRKAYVQIGLAKDEGFLPDGREALIRGAYADGDVCIEVPEDYVDLVWETAVEAEVQPQETGPNESTIFVPFTVVSGEEGTAFTSPIGFDDKPFLSVLLEMVQTKV